MADGTRTSPLREEWLELLCSSDLRGRVERASETGSALSVLVADWSDHAGELIGEFEGHDGIRSLTDDVREAVGHLVGVGRLVALCGELGELLEGVANARADG